MQPAASVDAAEHRSSVVVDATPCVMSSLRRPCADLSNPSTREGDTTELTEEASLGVECACDQKIDLQQRLVHAFSRLQTAHAAVMLARAQGAATLKSRS